ncbi:MAG: insulinase family protein [Firmicutes bacterium]|nr:insulinase family protein [Bacillota bacterium]
MELYVLPKPGYIKKYAIFSTRFGSIDNRYRVEGGEGIQELPDGVAHFLEHKLFEDERGNVFDRFASLGASANAFTSFTNTTYLFSCTSFFEENLELLLDFVQEPYFTEETVQKEQGIIGQEIQMYADHPRWKVFTNLLGALYQEHPVRRDIAGSLESIAQINPELLYRCYQTYYHPSNMAVFVVGDLEPGRVAEQVQENLSRRPYRPLGEIERFYPEEPPEIKERRVTAELTVSNPIIYIGFKDPEVDKLGGEELFRQEIIMELLMEILFGHSEPLYNQLYQEGLIDAQFEAGYTAEQTYGYALIGGESRDPEELYRRILEAIEEMQKKGISREQFERHRRNILGGFIRRFNSLEFIAYNFLGYRFKGIDLFRFPELLQQVTLGQVTAALEKNLAERYHAVSIINPRTG